MKHFVISTLGCKVNQCESAAIAKLLGEAGYSEASQNQTVDLIIINTCTVTGKAAMQSRQAIRRAIRTHPTAKVVVTGCYAQTSPADLEAIDGIDRIIGHADKLRVAEYLQHLDGTEDHPTSYRKMSSPHHFAPLPVVSGIERTRGFLKIQDGCNTRCTYCIVPIARGPSRSMPAADVLDHLNQLGKDGFHEVVLTGIHLGAYGLDLEPPTTLSRLLNSLSGNHPVERIRLSSIEPTEIDAATIDLMTDPGSGLCPHFHIPLQSGDNDVLKRMGRPYRREDYQRIVEAIRQRLRHAAIGADVMVGFPGEDESAFHNTFALIERLPITYLHVFPFSPREGTPAARYKGKVPEKISKERSKRLRKLGDRKKASFFRSQIGRCLTVLIETTSDPATGLSKGLSENYIPILLKDQRIIENRVVNVELVEMHANGTPLAVVVPD
jgi:threonylcarbamoyladenosine tRNA methylthiotransferase MtaB